VGIAQLVAHEAGKSILCCEGALFPSDFGEDLSGVQLVPTPGELLLNITSCLILVHWPHGATNQSINQSINQSADFI